MFLECKSEIRQWINNIKYINEINYIMLVNKIQYIFNIRNKGGHHSVDKNIKIKCLAGVIASNINELYDRLVEPNNDVILGPYFANGIKLINTELYGPEKKPEKIQLENVTVVLNECLQKLHEHEIDLLGLKQKL